jgi:probable rRNA maturation factor
MNSDDPLLTYRRKPARLDTLQLEKFARTLRGRVANGRAFHCLITGDAELRRLNRDFLGKDYATDVLSFPSSDASESMGDLAISLGRSRAQAAEWGHSVETEVQILMLHGMLHLLGMDHETDSGRMARAEAKWRKALGLPTGLIERVWSAKDAANSDRSGAAVLRGQRAQ